MPPRSRAENSSVIGLRRPDCLSFLCKEFGIGTSFILQTITRLIIRTHNIISSEQIEYLGLCYSFTEYDKDYHAKNRFVISHMDEPRLPPLEDGCLGHSYARS